MTIFSEEGAAQAWRQSGAGRAAYLARPTAHLFEALAIKPGAKVLVVGGGTGDEALEAARRVGKRGEVVLTDLSAGMVEEAQRAVTEAGHPAIRCLVMDAQDLDFPVATFDAVVARNVLMFIPDLHKALAAMRRVLKPGGHLAGTTWSSPLKNPRLRIPLAAAASVGVAVPPRATLRVALSLARRDRLAAALRRAGFAGVAVEKVSAIAQPGDWEAFLGDLRHHVGTQEIARLIPPDRAEQFWRSLDRRFLAHKPSGYLNGEQLVFSGTA